MACNRYIFQIMRPTFYPLEFKANFGGASYNPIGVCPRPYFSNLRQDAGHKVFGASYIPKRVLSARECSVYRLQLITNGTVAITIDPSSDARSSLARAHAALPTRARTLLPPACTRSLGLKHSLQDVAKNRVSLAYQKGRQNTPLGTQTQRKTATRGASFARSRRIKLG